MSKLNKSLCDGFCERDEQDTVTENNAGEKKWLDRVVRDRFFEEGAWRLKLKMMRGQLCKDSELHVQRP